MRELSGFLAGISESQTLRRRMVRCLITRNKLPWKPGIWCFAGSTAHSQLFILHLWPHSQLFQFFSTCAVGEKTIARRRSSLRRVPLLDRLRTDSTRLSTRRCRQDRQHARHSKRNPPSNCHQQYTCQAPRGCRHTCCLWHLETEVSSSYYGLVSPHCWFAPERNWHW